MKERPILFSAPMVRAILAGTKTQTRRIAAGCDDLVEILLQFPKQNSSPFGQPGDQLWVRERFCPIFPQDPHYNSGKPIEYDYAATYKHGYRLGDLIGEKKKWSPSIHMPRAASRITLEITSVRIEPLQGISIEDAKAEGVWTHESVVSDCMSHFGIDALAVNPRLAFQMLWDQINGPSSWDANPWVWVVEFKRMKKDAA
ncbi:MAG: hypothetical protein RLZZ22_138 [Pseudomonadota bacterium]|jgi:hypothetical protein